MANATKRPKKVYHVRKARLLPATTNLERLKCKLLERMYIFIYCKYRCTEHLEWDCQTLQCWAFVWECGTSWISYMSDSCSLSPPSGLRIKMLGLPCNHRSYQQSQKSYTCTNVSEKLTGLCSRTLMTPGPSSHESPRNAVEILLVCFSFHPIPKGD